MKLYTVIAYYITSITKELKFLNFHRFIVCSYCSVVCLIAKSELKMIKFSSSFKFNEIHTVNSPFNEDPKNIFFSREGRMKNLGKIGNNRDICCYANRTRISAPTPWYQNPCDASIFLHARLILGEKKMKNLNIHAKI